MFFVQPFASSKAMRPRVRAKVTDERLAQVCQRSQKALCDRLQHILGKRPNMTCTHVRKLGSTGKGVHGFLLFEFAFGQNKKEMQVRSDRALRGLISPPENWVQAVICSHLPAALEKNKPSWMGDDPRDVLVAMPAEGEVR